MIKHSDRISKIVFGTSEYNLESNSAMFLEDFSQRLVPLYGSELKEVRCNLEPLCPELEKIVINLFPSRGHRSVITFKDAVMNAISFIGSELVYNGELFLEFVTNVDFNDVQSYKLVSIKSSTVFLKGNRIIQFVPEQNESHDLATPENVTKISVPLNKCYIINFPKELGGTKGYLKFVDELRSFSSRNPTLNFFTNKLTEINAYNMTEHQKLFDIEMLKKTRLISWPHRGITDNRVTGYYQYYRHVKFRKTKIILRDYIINQFQLIIDDLCVKLQLSKSELKIEGLTPLSVIENHLKEWQDGKIDVKKAGDLL